jgi:hypothetical protein
MPPSLIRNTKASPLVIGWREDVSLPALGLGRFIAKVDTGARTAALHATDIEQMGSDVAFTVTLKGHPHRCHVPFKGWRRVKSSNGQSETRAVIETEVKIGKMRFPIEVTLTDRTDMGVPMLLGRTSLDGRFLVHPSRTHILAPRKRKAT